MAYFKYFDKIDYDLAEGITKQVTNLAKYTAIFAEAADDASAYSYYMAAPGERLDQISQKLYSTPDFYWTIPLLNPDIKNIWTDLARTTPAFDSYLELKYPGFALTVHSSASLLGKFQVGEIAAFDLDNIFRIVGKYPSLNYIHVEPVTGVTFDPLALGDRWVLFTGLWNDEPRNFWDDEETWRDYTAHIIGQNSGDIIEVDSSTPMHLAPAYYENSVTGELTTYNGENAIPVTWRELEYNKDEFKSRIKVIQPSQITSIVRRFEKRMKLV